ncbi:MAG: phosphoglucosamine mutase, partial [Armatimonadota bacterium]
MFRRLGATVTLAHAESAGDDINDRCGATHPAAIQALTVACGAEVGVAFDGDADRAIFADREGRLINGDR